MLSIISISKNYLQKRNIKRIIKIDFSAGTTLYPEFYSNLEITLQSIINQFWKNRITLVNFGRRYSRNLFKNLSSLKNSVPLTSLFKTVSKNILVLGTGESLEKTIEQLYTGANYCEYMATKYLCAKTILNGFCYPVSVTPVTDTATAQDLILRLKNICSRQLMLEHI